MPISEDNQSIDLKNDLVDLKTYRKTDALIVHVAYAQDNLIYRDGRIVEADAATYRDYKKSNPNDIVNKFGLIYTPGSSLLQHKRLADVLIDAAIDMHARYKQFTMVMDALRTYDSGLTMQENRPDLVELGLLAKAGTSAHNRALAVDSKLFEMKDGTLVEADEYGHLDDIHMETNSRFYTGPMPDAARKNRLNRLQAWQRASVKNKLPIANLLAEFWDDRVLGSPADMWRVLSCRALCIGLDGNPKTNNAIQTLKEDLGKLYEQNQQKNLTRQQFARDAHGLFSTSWNQLFTPEHKQQLETILGPRGGEPPALSDFLFHEWLQTIHDADLVKTGFHRQSIVIRT